MAATILSSDRIKMWQGFQPLALPTEPLVSRVAKKACVQKGSFGQTSASQCVGSMSEMLERISTEGFKLLQQSFFEVFDFHG